MTSEHRTIACLVAIASTIVIGIVTLRPATSIKLIEESDLFKIKEAGKASSDEIVALLSQSLQKANRTIVHINPSVANPKGQQVEIKGADKIGLLLQELQKNCLCGYFETGYEFSERIEFYADDTQVVVLEFEVPKTLRWSGGKWKGEVILTLEASAAFCQWFDKNGYPQFEKWRSQIVDWEKQERDRLTRFFGAFPPQAHAFLNHRISIFDSHKGQSAVEPAQQVVEAIGSPSEAAFCVFRAYGAGGKGWNGYDNIELIADTVMKIVDIESFRQSLNQAKEQDDQVALLGACRYFFGNLERDGPDYFAFVPEEHRVDWALFLANVALPKASAEEKSLIKYRLEQFPPNPEIRAFLEKLSIPAPDRQSP